MALRARIGDHAGRADCLSSVGTVLMGMGRLPEALEKYNAALATFQRLKDQEGIAIALNNVATVERTMGEFGQAKRHHEEALEILRRFGEKRNVAMAIANIGTVDDALEQWDAARARFAEALVMMRALGDKPGEAFVLSNLGVTQKKQGEYEAALRTFEAALQIYRAVGNRRASIDLLINTSATLRRLGRLEDAQRAQDEAAALLTEVHDLPASARIAWGNAQLQFQRGRFQETLALVDKGLAIVNEVVGGLAGGESAGVRDTFAGLFDIGYRAALAAGDPNALVGLVERGRAGSLREALGSRAELEAAVIPAGLLAELEAARGAQASAYRATRRAQQRRIRKAMREGKAAYEKARLEVTRVTKRIEREAKRSAGVTLSDPDSLAEIQARLDSGSVLLYYLITSESCFAIVVRKEQARIVKLASVPQLDAALDALFDGDLAIDPKATGSLEKLVVEPLGLAEDVRRVLVSPMGRLGYVPFGLLMPGRTVAYMPSGTTEGQLRSEVASSGSGILALGDPSYGTSTKARARGGWGPLTQLPGTREEVERVGTVRLLGDQASETGLRAAIDAKAGARWRAVHFACHGLVDVVRPHLSALALTADKRSDGFLTAMEIHGLKLPADLVVMSACETGKGRTYRTEGIVGLTSAFIFAGSPRVICSLWKVDDAATQALMIKFYELWNPKQGAALSAAVALKQAQAYIRDHPKQPKWKHPYYWAAWVLWGLPD